MAAWKGGHRPGTTPQQWAFARVNSMLTGGKADPDLQPQARAAKKRHKASKKKEGDETEEPEIDLEEFVKLKRTEIETLKKEDIYRKEFVGNVAHELKTPLFSVQGYISNLLDGAMDDKELLKKYLKRAEKSVERLTFIIKDLDLITPVSYTHLTLPTNREV